MINWVDKSDWKCRFFDAGDMPATFSSTDAIKALCECLFDEIIGKGTVPGDKLLLFEVNCDTGRLISGVTTHDQFNVGAADGCSARLQSVQDFWYDLIECELSDEQFSAKIIQKIRELGIAFRDLSIPYIEELHRSGSLDELTFRIFGSDPDVCIYEERFCKKL